MASQHRRLKQRPGHEGNIGSIAIYKACMDSSRMSCLVTFDGKWTGAEAGRIYCSSLMIEDELSSRKIEAGLQCSAEQRKHCLDFRLRIEHAFGLCPMIWEVYGILRCYG
jgi:hypothetical protein